MILIDVIDEDGAPTGVQKTMTEIHDQGLLHRAVHIWIYNKDGQILFQLRAMRKFNYPGLWDISAAGHVDAGEAPMVAALREAYEELGLKISAKQLVKIGERVVSNNIPEINIVIMKLTVYTSYLMTEISRLSLSWMVRSKH